MGSASTRVRILVIDDDVSIQNDFRKTLDSAAKDGALDLLAQELFGEESETSPENSYELVTASQGEEGVSLLAESIREDRPFALAFVDMRMPPGWDGLKTIEELWRLDSHLEIVLCTAYSDYTWSDIHRRLGRRDNLLLLKKPFDLEEVRQLASALTIKRQMRRQLVGELDSARHALADEVVRTQAIVETVPTGIITANIDGLILDMNPAARAIFALGTEPLLECQLKEFLPQAKLGCHEGCGVRSTGESFVCQTSFRSLELNDATLMIGTVADLTERKRDEAERQSLQAQLHESQKLDSLGLLAGGIAHDLNNLLVGVVGNAEEALQSQPTPIVKTLLDEIVNTSQEAASLIEQILAYAGKGKFARDVCCLSKIAKRVERLVKNSAPRQVEFEFNLHASPIWVEGDTSQLQQVIMNLVLNARDSLVLDGKVQVRTKPRNLEEDYYSSTLRGGAAFVPRGEYYSVEVTDNGCGMTEEVLSRLFDPFYSTKDTGRGLGLSAVLGIVREHGGYLLLESEVAEGSCFEVLLPKSTKVPVLPEPERTRPQKFNSGANTVLVVDDQKAVLRSIERTLKSFGLDVLTAEDGVRGLEIYRSDPERISAVLLDLTMPGMHGEEVLRELRSIRKDVQAILMSGFNKEQLSEDSVRFLRKPFRRETLLGHLQEVLLV